MIGGNCARRVIACKEVMRKEIGELTSSPACNQRIPSELLTQLQEVGSRCWRRSFVQKARRLLRSLHERCAFYRVRSDLPGPSSSRLLRRQCRHCFHTRNRCSETALDAVDCAYPCTCMTGTRNSYKPRERQLHSLRLCIATIQSLVAYQKSPSSESTDSSRISV